MNRFIRGVFTALMCGVFSSVRRWCVACSVVLMSDMRCVHSRLYLISDAFTHVYVWYAVCSLVRVAGVCCVQSCSCLICGVFTRVYNMWCVHSYSCLIRGVFTRVGGWYVFTGVHDCFHDLFCMNFICKKQWITAHQVWVGFFFPLCVCVCVCVWACVCVCVCVYTNVCFSPLFCCFQLSGKFFVLCVWMGVRECYCSFCLTWMFNLWWEACSVIVVVDDNFKHSFSDYPCF